MSETQVTDARGVPDEETGLKRSITGRLLFFYVLGDVLGSGIYVLIGSVAGAVGGAFWIAFAVGVTVATITGLAYAELVTKYPRAAGAALFVNLAFRNRFLTFLITVCMLSASFAAAGSLATGFAAYFQQVWALPPALLLGLAFIVVLAVVNFIGITESVVANLVMTIVEVGGLVIIMGIGVMYVVQGKADLGTLTSFDAAGKSPLFAVVAGVALAFFAMTGFENAANVAEETVEPHRTFPRALVGGMVVAGVLYVLVAITAALTVPIGTLADSDAALLEVIKADLLPVPVGIMTIAFAIIAMIAITNTTLVALVTESRILYGMAREDVVPGAFARIHRSRRSPWVALIFSAVVVAGLLLSPADLERLVAVTVVFTLFIYGLVIVAAMKLRGHDEDEHTFRPPVPLLVIGLVGNAVLLGYVLYTDPRSLIYCAVLLALGLALFAIEHFFGRRDRPVETGA
ncbi:APC family permease [Nocardioides mesophilus]|uniref:APC family permease n=1 Tax=Nocardioides mesophilus TaxID=433659 RepID=A0A7G9R7D2_9ACTN|nr:APC family permease [Nocardioides mesophilus]QNN51507.1 APC family permease [Nocardioides mesophilus]